MRSRSVIPGHGCIEDPMPPPHMHGKIMRGRSSIHDEQAYSKFGDIEELVSRNHVDKALVAVVTGVTGANG